RRSRAALVDVGEEIGGEYALDVRRLEQVLRPLVVDEQPARLPLLEQGEGGQVVADRLVDEPFRTEVEEHRVLALEEAEGRVVVLFSQLDARRHEVSVEAGVLRAELR